MSHVPCLPFALAALLGAAPAALRAADASNTTESNLEQTVKLDPFEVSASSQTEYGVTNSAGATLLDTPIRDIPQSISVLTKDFLDAIGAVNMQDAMIWVSGVSPRQNVADGTVIRSFLTTRTYNDGVRNFNGNYQSDLADFDRIEVIKGPAAAVIGTGEAGGYVNRVTKKPLDVSQGSVEFQTGSWDFFRTVFDSTGPVNQDKTLLYRVVAAYQHNDTEYPIQNQERTLFSPAVTWKPFADTTVLFQYEYQDIHDPWNFAEPFYAVGTGGTVAAPKDASFSFSRHLYQGQTFSGLNNLNQNLRTTVTQKLNRFLDAKFVANGFRGDVSGARTIMGTQLLVPATGDVTSAQSYGGVSHYIKTVNTQEDLVAHYDFGFVSNSTLVGAEYIWNYDYEQDYTATLPALDLEHPVYGTLPTTIAQSGKQLVQTNQEGYFAQQQTKFWGERLELTAGIRYDRSWITTWNYLTGAFSRTTPLQEAWVNAPRVGATFEIFKNLNGYGIWSQQQSPASEARQFPNSTTDFTQLITNQIAKLKEVGLKGDLFNGRLTATACYFDQSQSNFFQNTFVSQGTAQVNENIIVPGALCRGMEMDVVAVPIPNLTTVASFTHNFQYDFSFTGVPTAVVPKDKFTDYTTYTFNKHFSANFGGLYVGQQLSINGAQIYKHGGETMLNAGARYVFNPKWSVSLLVQNLTNKFFVYGLVSTTSNTIAPDRNWKVTLIRKW